jgi:REP element-mobilizing transposase RayT
MPNTYTQLYIHCVFAVKWRAAMLDTEWDERLRLYITAIAQNHKHKMLAINNMPDHLHCFVGLNPAESISDLMRVVKSESAAWINQEGFCRGKFNWQDGFGAFSHSKSQVNQVVQYIRNQQEHHKKVTFINEYKKMLRDFEVDFNEQYIFRDVE